jgi:methionyl-tRNA synthetase
MGFMNSFSLVADVHPIILAVAVLWSIIWKGFALWRAAGLRQKYWFAAILVINTLGVMEIIYLLATNKKAAAPQA